MPGVCMTAPCRRADGILQCAEAEAGAVFDE